VERVTFTKIKKWRFGKNQKGGVTAKRLGIIALQEDQSDNEEETQPEQNS
jgi:hypothetical protein